MGQQTVKIHDRRATDTLSAGQYAPMEVEDPMGLEPGDKIVVTRQLRGDPLARLHTHHQIDEAQYHAGRCYQHDWEIAERGARAIDPTKEAVDGGRMPEPITDSQAKARKRLKEVRVHLGLRLHAVAHAVLVDGMTMEKLVGGPEPTQSALKMQGNLFRASLDELAIFYGLADCPQARRD